MSKKEPHCGCPSLWEQFTLVKIFVVSISYFLQCQRDGPLWIRPFISEVYSLSGACPSWAGHIHSVTSILEKIALNDEFSGLHA